MKIFLDDIRNPPDSSWTIARSVKEAIDLMDNNNISEISFDHDLGMNEKTGYDLAKEIEYRAFYGKILRFKWNVHSMNPVGKKAIEKAMESAEHFWKNVTFLVDFFTENNP
ncbi:hypothetical protein M0R19_03530 [Candidatus Pacearchaeota archaeon]|nr:hypothetical protein [Candidatus Pacearchaeota archaeon]